MAQKKMVMGVAAFLLVSVMFVGWFALAADIGGESDPLVTLSYLKSLDPRINELISTAVKDEADRYINEQNALLTAAQSEMEKLRAAMGESFDAASLLSNGEFLDSLATEVAGKIGGGGTLADTFKKVEVESGKSVYLGMGALLLLRQGSAVCVASGDPGLIDLTEAKPLNKDGALQQNHLYTMTIDPINLDGTSPFRGLKATSKVTVFILGVYNVV